MVILLQFVCLLPDMGNWLKSLQRTVITSPDEIAPWPNVSETGV